MRSHTQSPQSPQSFSIIINVRMTAYETHELGGIAVIKQSRLIDQIIEKSFNICSPLINMLQYDGCTFIIQ